ncbi:putative siderophore transport system permease protein YfiZ precursor [Marinomonas gallaica]|uniref:Siderophore transport system permease protein YfiZ n=1 Tax=Marinomonas gallaica TaxID=1806667 RepID=A0A1C3JTH2_9GAMM|nr:putative siderophore transport system permease protein YfiZ precursor [Marinomonas gallaica]SBT22770.1 putative siderophore transport system permease protein YfiZ precursor [Marinomonas gallaica]
MCLLLVLACWLHLAYGAKSLDGQVIWQALFNYDNSNSEQILVREMRLNRLLVSLIVGAALALAGVLVQAVSRNPLADPGILGINSGAAFFVVAGLLFISGSRSLSVPLLAFSGALFAALLVAALSGRQQSSGRMILAGAAVAALFSAMTAVLLLVDQQGLEKLRNWLTGSVSASDINKLDWVMPYLVPAMLGAMLLAKSLNTHHLGDMAASGLGVKVARLKLFALLAIVVLSGSAVALVGPIGFIGLVVPHMARFLIRNDFRWLLPYSLILGAAVMVSADLMGRILVRPYEINTGIVTALIGAPVFIALVIWRVR